MSSSSTREIARAARELGGRVSVVAALVVALVSLIQHAPVWLSCARGAATLLVLSLATRAGTAALAKAVEFDRAGKTRDKGVR